MREKGEEERDKARKTIMKAIIKNIYVAFTVYKALFHNFFI